MNPYLDVENADPDVDEEEPITQPAPGSYPKDVYEEFWSDICWTEPPGPLG